MSLERPIALTVAGFDPSAGAGVLADVKTFEQLKVYGLAVSTAYTYQTESEVLGVNWLTFNEIKLQLVPLLTKYDIKACKIGIIENSANLIEILKVLRSYKPKIKIIWDPVFKSTSGYEFCSDFSNDYLIQASQMLDLITPNPDEHAKLASFSDLSSLSKNVAFLLKTHEEKESQVTDTLLVSSETVKINNNKLSKAKHGSGCVLSAAITAYLAMGLSLQEACYQANEYLQKFIDSSKGLLGFHNV